MRTTLGVDAAGTDNSTAVTLATVNDNYLTLSGQEITAGNVPISLGGTGATSAAGALTNLGLTATASEINLIDGSSAGTIVNSKAVIYGSSGEVNATTLQIGGSSITSTAAELNIMDGGTSATSTTLVDADRLVTNDNGTMVQVALSDLKTYLTSAGYSSEDPTALAIALG